MKKEIDYSIRIVQFYMCKCLDANVENNYVGHTVSWVDRKIYHKQSCNNEKHI